MNSELTSLIATSSLVCTWVPTATAPNKRGNHQHQTNGPTISTKSKGESFGIETKQSIGRAGSTNQGRSLRRIRSRACARGGTCWPRAAPSARPLPPDDCCRLRRAGRGHPETEGRSGIVSFRAVGIGSAAKLGIFTSFCHGSGALFSREEQEQESRTARTGQARGHHPRGHDPYQL